MFEKFEQIFQWSNSWVIIQLLSIRRKYINHPSTKLIEYF